MSYHKADNAKDKPEKTPRKINPRYLHNSGLYYLERFAASKAHFKEVMCRKSKRSCMHHKDQDYDACIKMVDELADKFEACGLLNDEVYANALAASLRRKGLSTRAAQVKMRNKGISFDQASLALGQLDAQSYETQEDAEFAAALKLARKKKIGPYSVVKDQDNQKSLGVLARAGFSYDIARCIIDMEPGNLEKFQH